MKKAVLNSGRQDFSFHHTEKVWREENLPAFLLKRMWEWKDE